MSSEITGLDAIRMKQKIKPCMLAPSRGDEEVVVLDSKKRQTSTQSGKAQAARKVERTSDIERKTRGASSTQPISEQITTTSLPGR